MRKIWKIIKFLIKTAAAAYILALLVVVSFPRYQRNIQHADAIIILGAAINTPALYNRSLEGLRLYEMGDANVLFLTGGVDYPKSISEAQYMQQVITASSSTTPPLVLDGKARSTYENILNAKKLLPKARSVIIVSDEFHLARGVIMAKSVGFSPVYWSAPKPTYYKPDELAYYYLREALALIAYVPRFLFG